MTSTSRSNFQAGFRTLLLLATLTGVLVGIGLSVETSVHARHHWRSGSCGLTAEDCRVLMSKPLVTTQEKGRHTGGPKGFSRLL